MFDLDVPRQNVQRANAVHAWLARLPAAASSDNGALSADLSDLYAAATYYQQALDALLATSPENVDGLAQQLADVITELAHIVWHADSALPQLEVLAQRLD